MAAPNTAPPSNESDTPGQRAAANDPWRAIRIRVRRDRRAQGLPAVPDPGVDALRTLASLVRPDAAPKPEAIPAVVVLNGRDANHEASESRSVAS
jgi:hypothetical protein